MHLNRLLLCLWECHHQVELATYIPVAPLISSLYSCVREFSLPGARIFEQRAAPSLARSSKIFLFILAIKLRQVQVVSTKMNNWYQNKQAVQKPDSWYQNKRSVPECTIGTKTYSWYHNQSQTTIRIKFKLLIIKTIQNS